jgi:hypothetical protein
MPSVIIPCSGQSTRFGGRPKWALTGPSGFPMVADSIRGLKFGEFDKLYFTVLEEHTKTININKVADTIRFFSKTEVWPVVIQKSHSQSHTVAQTIQKMGINGPIIISDCDRFIEAECIVGNTVYYSHLSKTEPCIAPSKSYVKLGEMGQVLNIVEKVVVSDTFCIGLYGFNDAAQFVRDYDYCAQNTSNEVYVSDVISAGLFFGYTFNGISSHGFIDWGTANAWAEYQRSWKMLAVDIDGTLCQNASWYSIPAINEVPILQKNVETLRKLYNNERTYIVLTTARPQDNYEETVQYLKDNNVPYHRLIMGLPHCQRLIVNDFASSNPYPSASAINIPRNSDTLADYL